MKQINSQATSKEVIRYSDPLALYDQYGSMAYGIILRIIPEPERAQRVLIDLFSSPQLTAFVDITAHTAGEIIRLARTKALIAKAESEPALLSYDSHANDTTGKVVFDLSFNQGYSLESIAEKLQVPRMNVLKLVYTYFQYLRSS